MFSLPPSIKESYCFFFDTPARRIFLKEHNINYSPGWIPQQEISYALFGRKGRDTVLACEKTYGYFLWAPEFSNVHATFSYDEKPIKINGEEYACSEGYYQSMKSFGNADYLKAKQRIRSADPWDSYEYGQQFSLRDDWDTARLEIMMTAIQAKFQDPILQELLLVTKDYPLVQIKSDPIWGSNYDGSGQNMLGVLLERLRKEILISRETSLNKRE